jgi:transposase InsO family protein
VKCFRFIRAESANHAISLMCRVLGVSRSGFHAWERRAPSERALADARLSERIAEIHARSRDSYGVRRVYLDLRDEGVRVGRKRVERLMRNAGLSGYVKRRKGTTTIPVPGVRVAVPAEVADSPQLGTPGQQGGREDAQPVGARRRARAGVRRSRVP